MWVYVQAPTDNTKIAMVHKPMSIYSVCLIKLDTLQKVQAGHANLPTLGYLTQWCEECFPPNEAYTTREPWEYEYAPWTRTRLPQDDHPRSLERLYDDNSRLLENYAQADVEATQHMRERLHTARHAYVTVKLTLPQRLRAFIAGMFDR